MSAFTQTSFTVSCSKKILLLLGCEMQPVSLVEIVRQLPVLVRTKSILNATIRMRMQVVKLQ